MGPGWKGRPDSPPGTGKSYDLPAPPPRPGNLGILLFPAFALRKGEGPFLVSARRPVVRGRRWPCRGQCARPGGTCLAGSAGRQSSAVLTTIPIASRPTSSRGRHFPSGIALVRLAKWVGRRATAWLTDPPNPLLFPGTVGVDRGEGESRQLREAASHRGRRCLLSKRRQGWKKRESGKLEGRQGQAVPPVKAELAVGSVGRAAHAGRSDRSLPHEACLGLPPEESPTLRRFLRASPRVPSPCSRPSRLPSPTLPLQNNGNEPATARSLHEPYGVRGLENDEPRTRKYPGEDSRVLQGAVNERYAPPACQSSNDALLAPNHATPHAQGGRAPPCLWPAPMLGSRRARPVDAGSRNKSGIANTLGRPSVFSLPPSPNTHHPHPHSTRKTAFPLPAPNPPRLSPFHPPQPLHPHQTPENSPCIGT